MDKIEKQVDKENKNFLFNALANKIKKETKSKMIKN